MIQRGAVISGRTRTSRAFREPEPDRAELNTFDFFGKLWETPTDEERHAALRFWYLATQPEPAEHHHQAIQADQGNRPFAAACRLGHHLSARLGLQLSPWDPASAVHVIAGVCGPAFAANAATLLAGYTALEDGRRAQTAFIDGANFAGILLKDSGRSPKGILLRAQWAVDQWPEGWRNREVLGGALYRSGDYQGAVRELMLSHRLRAVGQDSGPVPKDGQKRSSDLRPSIWSCHFLRWPITSSATRTTPPPGARKRCCPRTRPGKTP
jgi:hypothetical protein